jgi:diguanylate cyclase (GGDEF)-like protein/PAS domain S-box-containing protein
MIQDVTSQARRERLLQQQEAWLHAMLSGVAGYALVGLDAAGRVVAWNDGIGRLTGFAANAVVGHPFSVFYAGDTITPERVLDQLAEADSGGWSMDDGWRLRADGSRYWGSSLIAPLRPVDGTVAPAALPGVLVAAESSYYLILRDMSEQREAAEQARKAAVCDHLTGIGNRRAFFDAAETEVRRMQRLSRPLSVLLFDADHFKKINDSHGHPVGDTVLCHVAATLVAAFRPVDVVARIGGEEFAVLMPSTPIAAAQAAAERACRLLASSPAATDAGALPCTVSAGVATMDECSDSIDALLRRADKALYAAKAAGRNTVRSQARVDPEAPEALPELARAT